MGKRTESQDWVDFRRDDITGIESVCAHFTGHAYDPHDHDELLIGVTLEGLQRFNCHQATHISSPGKAILIEPGAVHDGHSDEPSGFTYAMLYLPQNWMQSMMMRRGLGDISTLAGTFSATLTDDRPLISAISTAFDALHGKEGRLASDENLDHLAEQLSRHIRTRPESVANESLNRIHLAKDYLHDHMAFDIGLDELSTLTGLDRFRLNRQFKRVFGLSPHAYLVRLRLRAARKLLAQGISPADAAMQVGFADQSHLGRWFQRAYRLSPALYQQRAQTF